MSDKPESQTEVQPVGKPPEAAANASGSAMSWWLAVRVVLKRVRFFAILLAVAMFIGYWDTVKNYWDKWTRPQSAAVRKLESDQEFFCPMHPNVIRDTYEPNGDAPKCPICGMPLSVRKKGAKEDLPPGVTGRVQLTPERIQLAGVQTVPVAYRPIDKQTTTVGYITFDESRLSRIVTRVSGYVEKLYVDKTYGTVSEGEPLAEIYSPDLYSTVKELVVSLQHEATKSLAASARDRLRLFGVSEQEIDEIVRSRQASPRLLIRSPRTGYVMEKRIVVGSSVEPGMTVLEVADLSAVWIEAEVYEKDVAFLQPGQVVEARVEAIPNEVFTGRLALVYPKLEAATRTNRVRFELENTDHRLRPGMFATVSIKTPLETIEPFRSRRPQTEAVFTSTGSTDNPRPVEFPVVPERAVVDTGTKKVVYVEREPGLFEGVEVELGPRVELREGSRTVDYYPVLKGLQAGDQVAAAGAFLIDAETRLNPAAASTYFGASGGPQSSGRGATSGGASSSAGLGRDASAGKVPAKPRAKQPSAEDLKNVAKLPQADRQLALQQRWCPITGNPLGSMGVPHKITLRDQAVWLCCKACASQAKRAPEETLAKIRTAMSGK